MSNRISLSLSNAFDSISQAQLKTEKNDRGFSETSIIGTHKIVNKKQKKTVMNNTQTE